MLRPSLRLLLWAVMASDSVLLRAGARLECGGHLSSALLPCKEQSNIYGDISGPQTQFTAGLTGGSKKASFNMKCALTERDMMGCDERLKVKATQTISKQSKLEPCCL